MKTQAKDAVALAMDWLAQLREEEDGAEPPPGDSQPAIDSAPPAGDFGDAAPAAPPASDFRDTAPAAPPAADFGDAAPAAPPAADFWTRPRSARRTSAPVPSRLGGGPMRSTGWPARNASRATPGSGPRTRRCYGTGTRPSP